MPEEFTVGGTAFETSKRDCVGTFLHLGSWREFVGRLPCAGRISFYGTFLDAERSVDRSVLRTEVGLEVVVIGVPIGSKREGEDDAGTSHEYDSASCGTTCEGVCVFQPRVVGSHRRRDDNR